MASTPRTSTSSSRRDTQASTSSNRSERSASRSGGTKPVESAVTRLLLSIKGLLEALTRWSKQEILETDVSDVYVRLGNDFNAAVTAFGSYGIDMSELLSVPDDLRGVLEQCLSEDATPENLEIYLPDVRKIITKLLQGLRGKQTEYRQIVSDRRPASSASTANGSDRPESLASRHGSVSGGVDDVGGDVARALSAGLESSDSLLRRSAVTMKGRKESISGMPSRPHTNGSDQFVGGFALLPEDPNPNPLTHRASTPGRSNRTPGGALQRTVSTPNPPTPDPPLSQSSTPLPEKMPVPRPTSIYDPVPSHVPRYGLSDRPMSASSPPPPAVLVDEAGASTPPNEDAAARVPPPPAAEPDAAPAVQNSLAVLRGDALERRASKRFSSFNISKMTGGSFRAGKMPLAAGVSLSPGDLVSLTGEEKGTSPARRGGRRGAFTTSTIAEDEEPPPVPSLPSRDASPFKDRTEQPPPMIDALPAPPLSVEEPRAAEKPKSTTLTVFLQVGREVKKVSIGPGLTFASLRVLFVDKFSYSPGKGNFPAVYIRDPFSGVQYELEDIDEIKDKCLLSLNIEPLDQIKQHIDLQISTLSQDIKDLRTMVSSNRRASMPPPMIIGQSLAENTPAAIRPSERTFRQAAHQISRLIPDHNEEGAPAKSEPVVPQMTGTSIQPQMTGISIMSETSARIVMDLKTQFDEVQHLRRDLGIMRQLYTEFMKQTKDSLGTLRTQTQNVRQLATTKVGGARAYIDDGKSKLDTRSQDVLTRMEELQDTVEVIKDDVLKRNVSPRPQVLKKIKGDIESLDMGLTSLKDHIQTVKPMWKKTWEEELQNIVEEQQFLSHQEEFLTDLLEDHKAVLEVMGHVEKVITLRGNSANRGLRSARSFKPPLPEEGSGGMSNVMVAIRTASTDAERRMKAIAASEKKREKDLSSRSDEFQMELTGFVEGKKLKMTGGAEEAERLRQKKNETTLKAMFSASGSGASTPSDPSLSPAT